MDEINKYIIELTEKVEELRGEVREIRETLKGSIDYNDRTFLEITKKKLEKLRDSER